MSNISHILHPNGYTSFTALEGLTALEALKAKRIWCVCREGEKFPRMPYGKEYAKVNDSTTWSDYADAIGELKGGNAETIGVVACGDGVVYLDIDGCRNPDTGEIVASDAQDFVKLFDATYIEASPSGTGLRVIATTTDETLKHINKVVKGEEGKHNAREIYGDGHFVRLSANVVNDKPITDQTSQLKEYVQRITLKEMVDAEQVRAYKAHDVPSWTGHEEEFKAWAEKNRKIFESRGLTINGDSWRCRSPLRDNDHDPSFFLDVRKGLFNDFGDKGGTFTELAELLGVDPPEFKSRNNPANDSNVISEPADENKSKSDEWRIIWDESAPTESSELFERYHIAPEVYGNVRRYAGRYVLPLQSVPTGEVIGVCVTDLVSPDAQFLGKKDEPVTWACGKMSNDSILVLTTDAICALSLRTALDDSYSILECFAYDNARQVASAMKKANPARTICVAFDYSHEASKAYRKFIAGDIPDSKRPGRPKAPTPEELATRIAPMPDVMDMMTPEVIQSTKTADGTTWGDVAGAFGVDVVRKEWQAQINVERKLASIKREIRKGTNKKTRNFRQEIIPYSDIESRNYPPKIWPVQDIVAPGVMMLSAKPKVGKTYLCFEIANAVAEGVEFLGKPTHKMPVLYIALEDDEESTKHRQTQLECRFFATSGKVNFMYTSVQLAFGTVDFDDLLRWLIRQDSPALVIIDTLTLATPERKKDNQDAYQAAVRLLHPLEIAIERCGGSVIFSTHNKKNGIGDIQEKMTGSMGNSATASGTLGLAILDYDLGIASLEVIARRGAQRTFYLSMDKPGFSLYPEQDPAKIAQILEQSESNPNSRESQRIQQENAIVKLLDATCDNALTVLEIWNNCSVKMSKSTLVNRLHDLVISGQIRELSKLKGQRRYQSVKETKQLVMCQKDDFDTMSNKDIAELENLFIKTKSKGTPELDAMEKAIMQFFEANPKDPYITVKKIAESINEAEHLSEVQSRLDGLETKGQIVHEYNSIMGTVVYCINPEPTESPEFDELTRRVVDYLRKQQGHPFVLEDIRRNMGFKTLDMLEVLSKVLDKLEENGEVIADRKTFKDEPRYSVPNS